MKVEISVRNKEEANALRIAMSDPAMKAAAIVYGILGRLPREEAVTCLNEVKAKLRIEEPPHA